MSREIGLAIEPIHHDMVDSMFDTESDATLPAEYQARLTHLKLQNDRRGGNNLSTNRATQVASPEDRQQIGDLRESKIGSELLDEILAEICG